MSQPILEEERGTIFQEWLEKEMKRTKNQQLPTLHTYSLKPYFENKQLLSSNIYCLPLDILPHSNVSDELVDVDRAEIVEATEANKKGLTCLLCSLQFEHHSDQVVHFKSDFHFGNIKRKSKGQAPVSEEEYLSQQTKGDQEDDEKDDGEQSNSSAESDKDSDDDEDKQESDDETDVEVNYDRYEYSDEYGKITKLFHSNNGPMFNFQLNSLLNWQFSLSLAMFPKESIFQSRAWNHVTSDVNTSNSLWNHFYKHIRTLQNRPLMAVFILRSGRFAGAIYNNASFTSFSSKKKNSAMLVHKVLRRYTVRAKAGGKQSSHDNKGSKARSVGAMLRRYGEKALQEDIEEIFTAWKDYLQLCGVILIASTKSMRFQLFKDDEDIPSSNNESNLLSRDDNRVCYVPFAVDRPTLENVNIIKDRATQALFHQSLAEVIAPSSMQPRVEGSIATECEKVKSVEKGNEKEDKKESALPVIPENHILNNSHTKEIFAILESSNQDSEVKDRLEQYIEEHFTLTTTNSLEEVDEDPSSSESENEQEEENHIHRGYFSSRHWVSKDNQYDLQTIINLPLSLESLHTPLHIASSKSFAQTIEFLFQHHANPESLDSHGRTPYFLAPNKQCRDVFRVMKGKLGKHTWDWSKTGIPQEITEEIKQQQKQKEKAKKKKKQQKKKERKVQQKEISVQDEIYAKQLQEQLEMEYLQSLQDQEYRNYAAEMGGDRRSINSTVQPPKPPAALLLGFCDYCQKEIKNRRDMQELFGQFRLCSSQCMQQMRRKLSADAAANRFHS